jgi:hypothetical protein
MNSECVVARCTKGTYHPRHGFKGGKSQYRIIRLGILLELTVCPTNMSTHSPPDVHDGVNRLPMYLSYGRGTPWDVQIGKEGFKPCTTWAMLSSAMDWLPT